MDPSSRCTALDANTFVLGLNHLQSDENEAKADLPTRFHFVLDNSGSMGHLTSDARNCFSELVSRATAPCSLVCFTAVAQTIGVNFTSAAMMRASLLPPQGQTNITAGVSMAIDIMLDIEQKHGSGKTHHILVLLSDGQHNKGPYPEAEAPILGKKIQCVSPNCQLSVVVVGVSRNSNTNMGMIMKTNLETLPLPSLLPIYFAVTPNDMRVALEQMREGIENVQGSSVNIEVLFEEMFFNKEKDKKDEEEKESSLWNKVTSGVKSLMMNDMNDIKTGILTNVGAPLQKSVDVWVNTANEEIPLLCIGSSSRPIAVVVKYSNGNIKEIPIFNITGSGKKQKEYIQNEIMGTALTKKKKNVQEKKVKKEWTCTTCTFINKSDISLACDVCGEPKQPNDNATLMNDQGEEMKIQEMMSDETKETRGLFCEDDEDGNNASISFINAGAALSQQNEVKEVKQDDNDDDEFDYFDEELATMALESLLEKARIQKIANSKTLNKNMMIELRKLISSFEKQMEIKKLKQEQMRNKQKDDLFRFDKLNGFDRVKQHKLTARALNGLKELQNQLAAIEAFDSKDSSSQAEFLNGSKSKYAAKALSRNAKRFTGEKGGGDIVDPMTALVSEFATLQDKMLMALRADMCKRVALATRETRPEMIEAHLKKNKDENPSPISSLSASTNQLQSSSTISKLVPNIDNRTRLAELFMKSTTENKNISNVKVSARKLIYDMIIEGITIHKIDNLLTNLNEIVQTEMIHNEEDDEDDDEVTLIDNVEFVKKELIQYLDKTNILDDCVDEYLATQNIVQGFAQTVHDIGNGNKERSSYLSLLTQREQLGEWSEFANECGKVCTGGAYEALMFLGTLAYPIDVSRRAATQLDPYAMKITRVRTSIIDTASLCCALKSNHELVPPEGGMVLSDALVLIDCDCPQASKLAAKSILLGEVYTSVVLSRDLNMYTGTSQRIALHAHALSTLSQSSSNNKKIETFQKRKDIEAMLKRTYLGKSYQCLKCSFGPIDHTACGDLEYHHNEEVVNGVKIDNSCPRCHWFSCEIKDWPKWNGVVPEETFEEKGIGKKKNKTKNDVLEHKKKKTEVNIEENLFYGNFEVPSRSNIEVLLRTLYSARILLGFNTCQDLVSKLSNWEESITAADGIDHPLQLVLALACICDEEMVASALTPPALLLLINEMCSRNARDILKMKFNTINQNAAAASTSDGSNVQTSGDESDNLVALSRKFVSQFLGISASSAPEAKGLEESEPSYESVKESCCADFTIQHLNKDNDDEFAYEKEEENKQNIFDFETFIQNSTQDILSIVLIIISLRKIILKRGGGWIKLAQDMETGVQCYRDVVDYLSSPYGLLSCGYSSLLDAVLNLKEEDNELEVQEVISSMSSNEQLQYRILKAAQSNKPFQGKFRMFATMTAQGFLHYNSNKRRSLTRGGSLSEPLGDVRDGQTLRNLCIDLRMFIYQERVQAKMRQWKSVGSDIVVAKARAADLGQYMDLFQSASHAHALDKPTFWGLWSAAVMDKSEGGEKVKYFLSKANTLFALKHNV